MELLENNPGPAGEELLQQQLLADTEPAAGDSDPVLRQRLENRFANIVQAISPQRPPSRIAPMRWTRVAAAAIILVLLGGGAYYWLGKPIKPGPLAGAQPSQNDIAPGSDKATLTLADGRTIALDSAASGALASQGGATIRKQGARLIYNSRRSAPATARTLYNILSTPRGGRYQLTLPDGTQVWLNAASSIRYPTAFTGAQRKVFVTGEAYFDVHTNAAMPFIVQVNDRAEVEVLGTRFNINAYTDEPVINTTLLEGKIALRHFAASRTTANRQLTTILSPGQQAQLAPQNEPVRIVAHADIEQVMAWKNGLFKFDNVDLKKLMRQLARWYDVEVSYEPGAPVSEQFVGEMQQSLSLAQVLKGLSGMGVHFRIEGRKLIVMP